jgi:uncharacterized protein YpiB (UPF0302 family)
VGLAILRDYYDKYQSKWKLIALKARKSLRVLNFLGDIDKAMSDVKFDIS